jgi:hypothetical protein
MRHSHGITRRGVVQRAVPTAAACLLVPLSGCTSQKLTIEGVETDVVDGQTVVVLVGVKNNSSGTANGDLLVQCNVQSGGTYTERREITVLAEQTTSFELRFTTQQTDLGNSFSVAAELTVEGPVDRMVEWLDSL